jgi:hypothetical protein
MAFAAGRRKAASIAGLGGDNNRQDGERQEEFFIGEKPFIHLILSMG